MKRGNATFDGVTESLAGRWRLLHVDDPHALTQASGWLRYTSAGGEALFRGQAALHPHVTAAAFRSAHGASMKTWATRFGTYLDEVLGTKCTCSQGSPNTPRPPFNFGYSHLCAEMYDSRNGKTSPLVSGTYRAAVEPLLQHYGLRTRWLDVVDNVWVALWFACHRQISVQSQAHFLRRSVAQEGADAMAYIVVMDTGPLQPTQIPGYQVGDRTRVIDLRYSVPSVYLRPHAQHGMLIAPKAIREVKATPAAVSNSLDDQVAAHIEIRLGDALEWLGDGGMTSTFTLFPPATKDIGFRRLLGASTQPPQQLGSITVYGPSY